MFNQSIIVMTKFKAQEIHCPSPPWNNQFSKILTGFLLLHKKKNNEPFGCKFQHMSGYPILQSFDIPMPECYPYLQMCLTDSVPRCQKACPTMTQSYKNFELVSPLHGTPVFISE